jgi:DNA-binding transcriptional ArsR family regulator
VAGEIALGLKVPEVLKDSRLPEKLRQALEEFWEWYDVRYAVPVEVDIEPGAVRIVVSHDIEPELRECEDICVKEYGEEVKRELKAEGVSEEEAEEKVWQGCHEACVEDIVRDLYLSFGEITRKLDKILEKYGVKAESEGGWDRYEYWVRYEIRL